MKKFLIVLTMVSMLTLTGCESDMFKSEPTYKLENITGDTFLLNQKTGDLSFVARDKLVKLEAFKMPSNKLFSYSSNIENKVDVDIKAKFVSGKMAYILTLKPKIDLNSKYEPVHNLNWFFDEIKKKKYEYNRINIDFMDSDGFELLSKEVYLSKDFTRQVDNNGDASAVIYNGRFSFSPEQVSNISNVGFTYSLSVLKQMPLVKKKASKL